MSLFLIITPPDRPNPSCVHVRIYKFLTKIKYSIKRKKVQITQLSASAHSAAIIIYCAFTVMGKSGKVCATSINGWKLSIKCQLSTAVRESGLVWLLVKMNIAQSLSGSWSSSSATTGTRLQIPWPPQIWTHHMLCRALRGWWEIIHVTEEIQPKFCSLCGDLCRSWDM